MKHVNYLSFFLLTLFSISFISCSDDDDNKLNTGITNQSWTEGKSLEISQDNELSVSFNAAAKWVASVTSGADWCKLNTTSGTKGQSTLKLSVSTSSTTDRTARISINIDGYSPASFEVTQKGTSVPQTTEDMEINAKVDEYLREMYLWNDEYKTLNLDHNKGYEDFFYDALGSMTTNT
ncbi:MAG: peptidase S41, partial [Bacteroides sp.]